MNYKEIKSGDIFAYYLERYGVYCPCQVVATNAETDQIALLFFNYFSKQLPLMEIVKKSPLLRKTHYYWRDKPICFWFSGEFSENFSFLGNEKIIVERKIEEIEARVDFSQIDFQYAWQQLPNYIQENFKSYDKNRLEQYKDIPEDLKASLAQKNRYKIILEAKKTSEELAKIKSENFFSHELESSYYDDDLAKFLAVNPIITAVNILENAPKVVDISKTFVNEFTLKVDGVEKIILNRSLYNLHLEGDFSALKQIECPFDGKLLNLYLHFNENFSAFSGLEKVPFLRVSFVKSLAISELKKIGTTVKSLWLIGKGGKIEQILDLKSFKEVEILWISDVFGFEEFPMRSDFPKLKELRMWSIPKTIGDLLKKEFKALPDLEIKQLRTEAWLKVNLENPFRNWDGIEGIAPAKAKKAMKIYADTYKELSKAGISTEEKKEFLITFLQIFNQIDGKWGIDTQESEDILEAFKQLGTLTELSDKELLIIFEKNLTI